MSRLIWIDGYSIKQVRQEIANIEGEKFSYSETYDDRYRNRGGDEDAEERRKREDAKLRKEMDQRRDWERRQRARVAKLRAILDAVDHARGTEIDAYPPKKKRR